MSKDNIEKVHSGDQPYTQRSGMLPEIRRSIQATVRESEKPNKVKLKKELA